MNLFFFKDYWRVDISYTINSVVLQKKKTLMYENLSTSVLFLLFPKLYEELEYKWVKEGWAAYKGAEVRIFAENYSALNQNLHGNIISRSPTPMFLVTPPVCYLHNSHDHTSF